MDGAGSKIGVSCSNRRDPTTNESSECCLTFSHQQKFLYVVIEKFIFITLLPFLEMDIDNINAVMDDYINCML